MPIINYKPTTPSRRNMSVTDYSGLSKVAPEKSLLAPLNKKSGRLPAATATAESPSATEAAETVENTASSISSVRSLTYRERSRPWNTILTVPLSSP